MSNKNISKIKEYAKEQSIEDTIEMILSNRTDYGGEQGGMVSVRQFNQVAKDFMEIFPQLKAIPMELRVMQKIAEKTENIMLSDLITHLKTDFEEGKVISYRIKVKQPFSTREIRYPDK